MASNYLAKSAAELEPVPNGMQDNSSPTSFEGTYTAAKQLRAVANTTPVQNLGLGYPIGTDSFVHSFRTTNFLTPALEAQTIGSQTWTVKFWASLNSLPSVVTCAVYARLFIWDGVNDTIRTFIGGSMNAAITQAAIKAYTVTTTGSAAITAGDKIGLELYHVVDDDPTDPAAGGILTFNIAYNLSTRDTGFTSPADILELAGIPLYYQQSTP